MHCVSLVNSRLLQCSIISWASIWVGSSRSRRHGPRDAPENTRVPAARRAHHPVHLLQSLRYLSPPSSAIVMAGDHVCPICKATFTRPQHVTRHMRSREFSLQCNVLFPSIRCLFVADYNPWCNGFFATGADRQIPWRFGNPTMFYHYPF